VPTGNVKLMVSACPTLTVIPVCDCVWNPDSSARIVYRPG
jgi:hypothetical protein